MKYAIIADIHAHLAALQAVLRDAEGQGCTKAACLGDIVGYFDKPKECVDLIRSMDIPCVKGNLDDYCSCEEPLEGFNPPAAEKVIWTRQQLTTDDRAWIRGLPLVQIISGFVIVHATLEAPGRWGYVFDKMAAAASFHRQTVPVCFHGHTHVPVAFVKDSTIRGGTFSSFRVEKDKQYFVNVGSVGQPRDGKPGAAYVTYDLDGGVIELRRVDCPRPGFPPDGGLGTPSPPLPSGPKPNLGAAADPSE